MSSFSIITSTKADIDFIEERIVEYNESNVSFKLKVPFAEINKHIKDEDGNIIAGINCFDYAWKCLYVDALLGEGRIQKEWLRIKTINRLEVVARKYEVQLIHLDTFDFQALDFYLKHTTS